LKLISTQVTSWSSLAASAQFDEGRFVSLLTGLAWRIQRGFAEGRSGGLLSGIEREIDAGEIDTFYMGNRNYPFPQEEVDNSYSL
jgi:hypothetical protein